jgi:hypothetical protein
MPLKHGYSKESISKNIETEESQGRGRKQAIAIALETARRAKRSAMDQGGEIEKPAHHEIVEAIMHKRKMAAGGMADDDGFLDDDMPNTEFPLEGMPDDPEHEVEGEGQSRRDMIKRAIAKSKK